VSSVFFSGRGEPPEIAECQYNYQEWYRRQITRIESRADRSDPAVLYTLSWSLPQLERMARGIDDPVLPPETQGSLAKKRRRR
jgi:hypothetical protein